jgi:hypothetical protein
MGSWEALTAPILCGRTVPRPGQALSLENQSLLRFFLEAVVDYHMFLHAPNGYTGNIGDLSVLTMSPLLDRMVGGTFHELETDAAVVPFKDNEEDFTKCFVPQISEIYEEHQGTNHSQE